MMLIGCAASIGSWPEHSRRSASSGPHLWRVREEPRFRVIETIRVIVVISSINNNNSLNNSNSNNNSTNNSININSYYYYY